MGNIDKFDCIADRYDTAERTEIAKIISDEIRCHVTDGKEKSAIDYGCGTGLVGMNLFDVFRSIFFIDASPNMIYQVGQKIERMRIKTAQTLCCDFETGCLPEIRSDYVIVAQTLLHIKNVDLILSRLYDVLNKGGRLLVIDFDKNDEVVSDEVHNGFVQEQLIETAKRAGFTEARAHTFYRGEKIFMGKDASLFILVAEK